MINKKIINNNKFSMKNTSPENKGILWSELRVNKIQSLNK